MAQTELEQIARAMMILAEDPERRRNASSTVAILGESCELKDGPAGSSISSTEDHNTQKGGEEEEESELDDCIHHHRVDGEEKNGETEEFEEIMGNNNYSIINPNSLSTPTTTNPSSPAGSLKSNESGSTTSSLTGTGGVGGCGGANSSSRRIFTPQFKQRVLEAFSSDPECIGNQRATARKFNIHRRQVQKWLQQQLTGQSSDSKDQPSSDEQEQKVQNTSDNNKEEADFIIQSLPPSSSSSALLSYSTVVPSSSNLPKSGNTILPARSQKNSNNSTKSNKSRSTRTKKTANNKMPIVAGKGPSIPQGSAVSSSPSANLPSSSPLMNLGKGLGNIHHPLFSSNSFLGLSSPLLSLPLALEANSSSSSHRHSPPPPRQSPPNGINGNSPINGNHHHHNLSTTAQRMLELVDELCYLYPSEDFSLLRTAMLKNEVSFTKLSPPLRRQHNNNSSRKNNSSSSSSPAPANDYITQQTLQMIKNQNEYLQLLQSGYANLSHFQDAASEHGGGGNGKYASWLNPFAAAAGYNVQQAGFHNNNNNPKQHGNGLDGNRKRGNNGNGNNNNNNIESTSTSASSAYHNFASPKAPVSNSKSKTVAAVLALNRNGPQQRMSQNSSHPYEKITKRPAQNRRKMTNGSGRPMKSYPSPPNTNNNHNNDDDYLDPTSMLEVVTSKPSPIEVNNMMDSYGGMDLSTTSVIQKSPSSRITTTAASSSSTIRSKAMNKDYGFLSELGLIRKEQEDRESNNNNGRYGQASSTSPPVSSLEHFVDNVLSLQRSSPQTSSSGSPGPHDSNNTNSNTNNYNHHHDQSSADTSKDSVLTSYNFDPEVSGDARAVARKFGLNIRVVQKWIREAPTRSIPSLQQQYNGGSGHGHGENGDDADELDEDEENDDDEAANDTILQHQQQQYRSVIASTSTLNSNNNGPTTTTTVNKRKNPKPNQICDFTEDDLDENGALDMVVPIKKRRVSSTTPTSA